MDNIDKPGVIFFGDKLLLAAVLVNVNLSFVLS